MRLHDLTEIHARRHAERVEHDVDRRAVLEVRHVLFGEHLRDHTLVAVAPGHLVALENFSLLRDVDAHQMVDAGRELVAVLAREDLDVDDFALLAMGHFEARVAHLARLLAENRAQQPLLGRQLGLALGRHLADENIFGTHFCTDADDAALVEIFERVFADVGNVARDLFGPELGVARFAFVLFDVNRGEAVFLDHAFADEDGVLVVVTFPRHERDQHVLPEGELALIRRRSVDDHLPGDDLVADRDDRALVDARAGVAAHELEQLVRTLDALAIAHGDALRVNRGHAAGFFRDDEAARILGGPVLHAGSHDRRGRTKQRNGLTLHVCAHERAVGIIVLEERNQRGGNGDDLLGGNVHELDPLGRLLDVFFGIAADDRFGRDSARLGIDRRVGLRDDVLVFFVGRQVFDLVRDDALACHSVRRLDEPELIDPRVGCQRADQADVRPFRRFDRTDSAVVRVVDVETGALARETARPQRR